MKDFCYWETEFHPENGTAIRTKWLLVKREIDGELVYKFNLTRLGVENINSFAEFQKLFLKED